MIAELRNTFGPRVKLDEPLSRHTTFHLGGPADAFVEVENPDELRLVLDLARRADAKLHIIGSGSNLLVRDAGVRGIVVKLVGPFRGVAFDEESKTLRAGAGALLSDICDEAIRLGINNLCWTAGIPGTLGGALVGNAGAWSRDIGEFVESVTVMTRRGEVKDILPRFSYRHTEFPEPGLILLGARLRLANIDVPIADPKLLCRDYIERKRRTQPLDHPSAGSVFKNPAPDRSAGLLIDKAGCRGLRIEGACVSPRHANFIVNDRHASAGDVVQLIDQVRSAVKAHSGVELELEIQVW